jgi:hypothetical protein
VVLAACVTIAVTPTYGQIMTFTYQGQLKLDGLPLTDSADFAVTLWDALEEGTMIGPVNYLDDVLVANGLFTLELDFGATAFNGHPRFLEIALRSPHDPDDVTGYTTLDPRQRISGAPYASRTRGLHVNEAGDLGIATSSPDATLHVAGDALIDAELELRGGMISNRSNYFGAPYFTNTGGSTDAGVVTAVPGGFGGPIYEAPPYGAALIAIAHDAAYAIYQSGDGPVFFSGDVGLGTDEPQCKLHVEGDARMDSIDAGGGIVHGSAGVRASVPGGVSLAISDSTPHAAIYAFAEDPDYAFYQVGVEAPSYFRGNVGIGTENPSSPLTIDGAGLELERNLGSYADTRAKMLISSQSGPPGLRMLMSNNNGANFNDALYISENTRVGVGSTSPAATFHVASDVNPNVKITQTDNGDYARLVLDGGGNEFHLSVGAPDSNIADTFNIYRSGTGNLLSVTAAGHVGIGDVTPESKLDVNGNVTCWAVVENSSRALKKNITPIKNALNQLARLQGVRFRWAADHGGHAGIGLIAEEVAEIFPELVTWEEKGVRARGIKYGHLTAVAVEAIKQLRAKHDGSFAQSDRRIRHLERQNARLSARLDRLESVMASLTKRHGERQDDGS